MVLHECFRNKKGERERETPKPLLSKPGQLRFHFIGDFVKSSNPSRGFKKIVAAHLHALLGPLPGDCGSVGSERPRSPTTPGPHTLQLSPDLQVHGKELPVAWLLQAVHKPHAARAAMSSCMGTTFRWPCLEGVPSICLNVSPSIKTDRKSRNTNGLRLPCKSYCKKIACYYFRTWKA